MNEQNQPNVVYVKQPEKNMFLYVSSILLIIFASIALFLKLLLSLGIGAILGGLGSIAAKEGSIHGLGAVGGIAAVIFVVMFIGSIFNFVAGIYGIKGSVDPSKAKVCLILGCVMIGLWALGVLLGQNFSGRELISVILPCIYTFGAYQVVSEEKERNKTRY